MKSLLFSVAVFLSWNTMAQLEELNGGPVNVPTDGIVDGVYIAEHIPTKRLIPYEYVREADVIWSKRVWQYIDLREKINHNLYYPFDEITLEGRWIRNATRWSLWTVLRNHVLNGDLRLFSPYNPYNVFGEKDGDQLKYPVDPLPGMNFYTDSAYREQLVYFFGYLGPQSDVPLTDEFGDPLIKVNAEGIEEMVYPNRDTMWYVSKDIVQYKIKEDWFFDKERSVLDVRILAIAPVVYDIETNEATGQKSIKGLKDLFWLYFPHCRFVLNNYFVYNDKNDAQWMSFDDVFWKRRFNSTIYKSSNVYDRKVDSYRTGVDALMESDKIKEEIRTIEHDVWSF
ncbi:MAG: gliding motility protein GldN [Crocinitomicaceae bacterium]|nr:gliding motility protein GldN [Crocinitomicaceae bacterium]MDP4866008.1 gliding motility protein GldN [Crocinitomicaceae bacterium]MDP5010871.1 gliding motility protein GldN [Crocinitomicaceae bacterium]